jgi:hypothetical protein
MQYQMMNIDNDNKEHISDICGLAIPTMWLD